MCRKSAATGSIQCLDCEKWFHKNCSGIKSNFKDMEGLYVCEKCTEKRLKSTKLGGLGETNNLSGAKKKRVSGHERDGKKEFDLGGDGKLEYIAKFCYLCDMIGASGGTEDA